MPAPTPRLLAFAGSLRSGSYNRRLVHVLADGARASGADVTLIELRDHPLPLYDGDIEAAGMPDGVRVLQQFVREHDGLLVSESMPPSSENRSFIARTPTTANTEKPRMVRIIYFSP